ncbi:hypothetical protein J1N35_040475 [Gossypium stocksii]|uniref:Aminotransferase-like plant mobile domain-containing protein n=1 Tax=Gossypium stocksii TaxID=47602 RepID=A0A9D3UDM3_9ROSI|nr:hypothetical protein J1N35_040475 [Gossypium stocksii]
MYVTYFTATQELNDLHKINLRGRLEGYWPKFHNNYIEMWQRRYDYLPMRESFLTSELGISPDYIDWFKHNNMPYLLPDAERSRHVAVGGQDEGPSILGREKMSLGDQHLLQLHRKTRLPCIFHTTATHCTILHVNASSNADVLDIVVNSHILSIIGLCDTIQLSTNNVAKTPNIVVLLRDQHQGAHEDEDEDENDEEPPPQVVR